MSSIVFTSQRQFFLGPGMRMRVKRVKVPLTLKLSCGVQTRFLKTRQATFKKEQNCAKSENLFQQSVGRIFKIHLTEAFVALDVLKGLKTVKRVKYFNLLMNQESVLKNIF